MQNNDRFSKFGAPQKQEEDKKTKKVLLSMTQKQYDKMQRFQKLFNKNTLTSTIEYLITQGESKVLEELESFKER